MQGRRKLVSVIIPAHGRVQELEACIRSVLLSAYEPFEIIVVDNNAEDAVHAQTEALVRRMAERHDNIFSVHLPAPQNGSAARNAGFKLARGKYVMFLDDDDLFFPEKMAAQAAFLDVHDEAWGACYTSYVDERGGKVTARSMETREGELLIDELARNLFVHGGSNLMLRREVVEELGGFDEHFSRNQDQEFLIRMLRRWKLGFVNVTGLMVNIHARPGIDNIQVTERFMEAFGGMIDALPGKEGETVRRMLALQDVRAALKERHDPVLAGQLMRRSGLTLMQVGCYILHLVWRKKNKISCGYNRSKLRRRNT